MRILVLNGSPKGSNSITLQTVEYLKLLFPEHEWETLHVGQRIRSLEKDFAPAREALARAELLLFSYPVYTFIAPAQLHRFVELMKEHAVDVRGKWASQISTSKHFYDVTAHRYVMENAQDMGMKFVRGLSADMDDLTMERGQKEAEGFFRRLLWSVENGCCEPDLPAQPAPAHVPVTAVQEPEGEKPGDVVILTDCRPEDTQLAEMIARFRAVCPKKTRVINIREYPFRGGCLGCFQCASASTRTTSTNSCAMRSRPPTRRCRPSPSATTGCPPPSSGTATGSSATVTAPSAWAPPSATSSAATTGMRRICG